MNPAFQPSAFNQRAFQGYLKYGAFQCGAFQATAFQMPEHCEQTPGAPTFVPEYVITFARRRKRF
jgi:hypothetical protein